VFFEKCYNLIKVKLNKEKQPTVFENWEKLETPLSP
jgi:hypothetical protein